KQAMKNEGSLIFAVKKAAFWGVSVRTHAHTPKCGGLLREFLKNQNQFLQSTITSLLSNSIFLQN
ncbi:MAG: hypothetical protein R6W69_14960, partial [Anaerolineales bacterium]